MFTTFMVPLFIFIITNEIFSKMSSSLNGKRLLYPCYLYIYIINHYLNKIKKLKKNLKKKKKNVIFFMFSNYTFSN